ncbi:hypothetical protein QE152_g6310 [Popillia japonica]|uniref:NACHT domain-containing protein n=1 Tax=Popillia japonica TaxID=7064 RepID=A0AAW1MJ22_POPJA
MADDLSFTKNFGKFHHNSHISYLLSKSKLGLGQNPGKDWFNTIKKFYEELDGIPEISSVLRVLEHTENLEVIFDFEASSILDLDPTQSSSTSGSCDYKTGRLYLGAKHDFGAVLGTLAHEFTHLAVQIVYDNECNPYGIEDAQTKSDFAEIIEECRLKPEGDPIVKRVFTAYKNPEDWASELIVRVPHLLAYYYDERDDAILSGLEEDFRGLFEFFRVKILPDLLRSGFGYQFPEFSQDKFAPHPGRNSLHLRENLRFCFGKDLLHTLEGIPCIFAKISDFASGRSAGEICQAAQSELAPILVVDCSRDYLSLHPYWSWILKLDSRDYGLGGDDFWNFFNSKIRLILITNPKENWLNQNEDRKVRRLDLDYNWDDLTEDSQRILLQTRDINFQGKSIKFDQILQRNSRLCHEFLDKMLNQNEDIVIGEPPAVFDGDYYYIERKLIVAQIEANFPAELIRNPPSRMMVISDEVGVGKTTILKHISKEVKDIFPNFWVVRLNLMDFAEIFEEFLKKRVQILQLLLQILTFNNGAESELFIELLRSKRVIFLLDSFDELDPTHKPIIIEILQYLDQIKLDQIWITTRFYSEHNFGRFYSEHNFGRLFKMTSCYLEPLTLNDQLDYLSDYWRKFLGVPPTTSSTI